jgi:2-polyprenyl-3-methyl-5-hydroxy-6-metoxy-1,4-benzoquinol methylase
MIAQCSEITKALADFYWPSLKGRSAMDIGCSTGSLLYELQQKYDCQVMGVELQQEAVEIAKAGINGNVLQMDVDSSEFLEKKYDVVTLTGVIEHVVQPNRLSKRVSDLLKDGGVIMIQTPNAESLVARLLNRYWPALDPVEHIPIHSKKPSA